MSDNIATMNDKQLRNEVKLLRDELAIMRRKYEDIIYNLDTDNFSSRFVKEQGDMRTAIEVNAEGIKTKVSNAELESTMTQLAGQITSEVTRLDSTLSSRITQTNDRITSEVKDLSDSDEILSSAIEQTASDIKSVVSKNISVKFESNVKPTSSNTTNAQKGMLCEYNGTLYYYNDITNTWKVYPYADGISSQFLQTSFGFELTGDVSISGDAIVGGTITGSSIQNSLQTAKLILGHSSGSTVGDLQLIRVGSNEDTTIFSVYDNFTSVDLLAFGTTFLYTSGETTYPMGKWDFQFCNPLGIGGGGGTAKFA